MALQDKKLTELPEVGAPSTGLFLYAVQGGQSYKVSLNNVADLLVNDYSLLTINLPANLMSVGNAELILGGLNFAVSEQLESGRISSGAYYDIDGGVVS